MTKKISVLLCGFLLLSTLTACGQKETKSEPVTSGEETVATIKILEGKGEVFPYTDDVKNYLQAPYGSPVDGFVTKKARNQAQGIALSWECDGDVESYVLRYGKKGCSDKEITEVTLKADVTSYELFNLYKSTEYDWSVTAKLTDGETLTAEESFTTTSLGPRVMQIDGIYNTRDLGGWTTVDGKTVKQGLLYRGGALTPGGGYQAKLTVDGRAYMMETLGIKTDLDIRGKGDESGYTDKSVIPDATLVYTITDGYMGAFRPDLANEFRKTFAVMADENNYPIYFHCTGGADRTGTVAFLVNALLGVAEENLIQDYELTTFSIYNTRSARPGTTYGDMFQDFLTTLKTYEGETLADKTENYMLSIGLTEAEIANIRNILLG